MLYSLFRPKPTQVTNRELDFKPHHSKKLRQEQIPAHSRREEPRGTRALK